MAVEDASVGSRTAVVIPGLGQGLTISLFLSLGIMTALIITNTLTVLPSEMSDPDSTRVSAFLSVLTTNLNWATILCLTITLLLLGTHIGRSSPFTKSFSMVGVTNVLVYLCGVSIFLPFMPVSLLAFLLVLCMLSRRPGKQGIFKSQVVFFAFIVLNVFGLTTGLVGIDKIRAGIPIGSQLLEVFPYILAFIIYFIIKRNGWRLHNFERFFKIIMIGGLFLSVEALLTFYVGRSTLPYLSRLSVAEPNMFQSIFFQSQHYVGRIGLTTIFMALYFYYRTRRNGYILAAILGGLLVFSTSNRQVILSCLLGLGIVQTFSWSGGPRVLWNTIHQRVVAVILLGLLVVAGQSFIQSITVARNANSVERTVRNRLLHTARAVDVLWYTSFLGTGPGLDGFYRGSSSVPTTIAFDPVVELLQEDRKFALGLFRRNGLEDQEAYSVHSIWVRFILQLGVAGLIFLIYLVSRAWKLFRKLRGAHDVDTRAAWTIFSFACALSLSMATTVKFSLYWYFVLAFVFAHQGVRELIEERRLYNKVSGQVFSRLS